MLKGPDTSNNCTVSIVMPICHAGLNLRRTLDTIQSQTYKNWEIICVLTIDDNKSATVLHEYAVKDKRIKIITSISTLIQARNTALDAASGEWIMNVDGGDCLGPKAIEKAISTTTPDVDCVCFGIRRFSENRLIDKGWKVMSNEGVENVGGKSFNSIPSLFSGKLWRNSVIQNYNIRFSNDLYFSEAAFFLTFMKSASQIAYLPDILYAWLEHDSRNHILYENITTEHFDDVEHLLIHLLGDSEKSCNESIHQENPANEKSRTLTYISYILKDIVKFPAWSYHHRIWTFVSNYINNAGLTTQLPFRPDVALYYHLPPHVWPELSSLKEDAILLSQYKYIRSSYHRMRICSKLTWGRRRKKYAAKIDYYRSLLRRCRDLNKNMTDINKI